MDDSLWSLAMLSHWLFPGYVFSINKDAMGITLIKCCKTRGCIIQNTAFYIGVLVAVNSLIGTVQ